MFTVSEFESVIESLVNNEVDKVVISTALSQYCNSAIESIKNFVSFRVLRYTCSSGELIKGFIHYDNMTASVELDFIDDKYIMRSLNRVY